jgi:hypothetical protein
MIKEKFDGLRRYPGGQEAFIAHVISLGEGEIDYNAYPRRVVSR